MMASFTRGDEQAWCALALAASSGATSPELMLAKVQATAGKVMPCANARDQSAFVALQALARAAAQGPQARRARLSECLNTLAADCASVAGWNLCPSSPHADDGRREAPTLDLSAA